MQSNHSFGKKSSLQGWSAAIVLSVMTAVILAVPYFLAYQFTNPELVYTGLIMNPEDAQTYWAKMLQGYAGNWFYIIPFTPEVHDAAMVGVFYIWLGQLARILGMSLTAVWHLSRIIAGIILFLTIYWFITTLTTGRRAQWTAFILSIFGSGLGWLLFLLRATYWLDAFPVDFKQPGAHIFFTAMTFPHITIGTACILVSMWALHKLSANNQTVHNSQFTIHNSLFIILLANLSNFLLAIAYPFLLYLVIGTAVLIWIVLAIQARTILWKKALTFAATCILPAPLYLYYAYTLQTNAVFAAWDAQAGTPSAPWLHYLVAFGPYLLLAGILWWKRPSTRQHYLTLWCWLLTVALLLYAPLNPQRRFLQGVHVPLAVLTTLGFVNIILPWLTQTRLWQRIVSLPRYETPKLIRLLLLIFLLIMSISNLYLWGDVTRTAVFVQPYPLFRPADEVEAAQWLQENVPTSAILLGAMQTGNLVAARAGQRVIIGHWAETVDYTQKEALVAQFFTEKSDDQWRQRQLEQYNIHHVWHGPQERVLGTFDPGQVDYLAPVFSNKTITIYAASP